MSQGSSTNCTSTHCIFHCYTQSTSNKYLVLLKNILHKTVNTLLNHDPKPPFFFFFLIRKWKIKHFCCLKEKHFSDYGIANWSSHFFQNRTPFSFEKKKKADRLYLCSPGYFEGIFSKMNKVSLAFWRKQFKYLLPEIWAFKPKLNVGTYCELESFCELIDS